MILWTIEPIDRIFPTEPPKSVTMSIKGGLLEGTRTPEGFAVTKLISTDPKLYLDPTNAPGYIRKK